MRRALFLFTGVGLLVLAFVGSLSLRQGGGPAARPEPSPIVAVGDKAAFHCLEAKATVTRRLIDGELTLAEAAAWFRYLDAQAPSAAKVIPSMDAGLSEEERLCREALRWAQAQALADGPPEKAEALVGRLEAELSAHLHDAAPAIR